MIKTARAVLAAAATAAVLTGPLHARELSGKLDLVAGEGGYFGRALDLGWKRGAVSAGAFLDAYNPPKGGAPVRLIGGRAGYAIGPAGLEISGRVVPGAGGYRMIAGGGELTWRIDPPSAVGAFLLRDWALGGLLAEHTQTIKGDPGQLVTLQSHGRLHGSLRKNEFVVQGTKIGYAPHHGPLPVFRHIRLAGVQRVITSVYPDYSFLLKVSRKSRSWTPSLGYVYTGYKLSVGDTHHLSVGADSRVGSADIRAELQFETSGGSANFLLSVSL